MSTKSSIAYLPNYGIHLYEECIGFEVWLERPGLSIKLFEEQEWAEVKKQIIEDYEKEKAYRKDNS